MVQKDISLKWKLTCLSHQKYGQNFIQSIIYVCNYLIKSSANINNNHNEVVSFCFSDHDLLHEIPGGNIISNDLFQYMISLRRHELTMNWSWRLFLASRLWTTLVLSKQSIQLVRNTPSWLQMTVSPSNMKYL